MTESELLAVAELAVHANEARQGEDIKCRAERLAADLAEWND